MHILEKIALTAGLVVAGCTLAYRHLLTEEQREELRGLSASLSNASHEVSDSLSPLVADGTTHAQEQERIENNRARTRAQWEVLGY